MAVCEKQHHETAFAIGSRTAVIMMMMMMMMMVLMVMMMMMMMMMVMMRTVVQRMSASIGSKPCAHAAREVQRS